MNNNKEYLSMYFKDVEKVQTYAMNNDVKETFDKCLLLLDRFKEEFCSYS